MRSLALAATLAAALLAAPAAGTARAQAPVQEPAARLRTVLPPDVAERVLARIAAARARQLPTAALENRALKFAAKGVAPADIERAVAEQAERMVQAREAISRGRGRAEGAEIEAAAEALRLGVRDAQVSELAREAPSGRSLAVPLYVVGSLIDRGLSSDAALERVQQRLLSRATDVELERLPAELPPQVDVPPGQARRAERGSAGENAGPARPEAAGPGQNPGRGSGQGGGVRGGGRGTTGPPGQAGGGGPGGGVGKGGNPGQGGGRPTGRPPGAGGKPAGTPAGPPTSVPTAGAGKDKGKKPPGKPDKPGNPGKP